MVEIWRDIDGYEGLYQVSNFGRVKALGNGGSKSKEMILKQYKNKNGYMSIGLYKNSKVKRYSVHRLVAAAFVNNPDKLPMVNHKDECKTNNVCSNLEWCDHKYNMNYGTQIKRMSKNNTNHPKKSKKVLCVETGVIYPSTKQVERELGFLNGYLSKVCTGKYETAYGFHWRYIN